jgi:hypothetical protein
MVFSYNYILFESNESFIIKEALLMGAIAAILGGIGGLCAVMGVVTAAEVIDPIMYEMDTMFWFVLAVILLLSSITLQLGHGPGHD